MFINSKLTGANWMEPYFQEKILIAANAFLHRVKQAINYCESEYLLLMDPDALVRGLLTIPDGVKLLGSRINSGFPKEFRDILKSVPGAIDINCWGATPAIIHCDTFLKAHKYVTETDVTLLPALAKTNYAIFAHDVLLPVLFAIQGYEETFNPDIVECNRNAKWESTSCPLVHQFKKYYDKYN